MSLTYSNDQPYGTSAYSYDGLPFEIEELIGMMLPHRVLRIGDLAAGSVITVSDSLEHAVIRI